MYVLGMSETHLRGCGVVDGRDEDEGGLWEGLEEGVSRWDGLSNKSVYERCGMRGRGSVV